MKKSPLIIPIIIMLLILATMLVFMALPLGQVGVKAEEGKLDLRGAGLGSSMYQLGGQWQCVPGVLVEPDNFPATAHTAVVPEKWPRTDEDLNRCATYRLTVFTDDTRMLTLFIPEIPTAYKLWINGEYIRSAGVVSESAEGGFPTFENALVPARARDGIIEIVIQASNYHYMRPLMNNLLLLGENDAAYSWFFRTRIIYVLALGFILAGVFYHISLYMTRRKEIIYLLFSFLGLMCFWRYALETNGVSDFAGWFTSDGINDIKIFTTLLFLHGAAVALFSMYVFDREWTVKRLWKVAIYIICGAVLYYTIPWNTHLAPLIVIATLIPLAAIAIYRAARSRVLKENKMMWLYLTALVLFVVVSVTQKYFLDHLLFMTGLITDMFLLMVQALVLAKNYAETREHEKALEDNNALLDRLNNMKNELLQNMSHDLKTPLTVISTDILNAADCVDYEIDKEEVKESLEHAQREIMRMARMVDGAMRHFFMQENEDEIKPVNLASFLREGAETYRAILERTGNALILDIPEALPDILGNADTLLHVLSNLLSNANRHTRGGTIKVSAAAGDGMVSVTVKDDGTGIKPELLPYIFERGVSDGGTGLGLSICKAAIEAHGGDISAESEYGHGTAVTFSLPVYEQKQA